MGGVVSRHGQVLLAIGGALALVATFLAVAVQAQPIDCPVRATDPSDTSTNRYDIVEMCASYDGGQLEIAMRTREGGLHPWSAFIVADGRQYDAVVEVPDGAQARVLVSEVATGTVTCEPTPVFGGEDGWRGITGMSTTECFGTDHTPLSVVWFGSNADRAPDAGALLVEEGDGDGDGDPTGDGPLSGGCTTRIADPEDTSVDRLDITEACAEYDGATLDLRIKTVSSDREEWGVALTADGVGYTASVEISEGQPDRAIVQHDDTGSITCEPDVAWGPDDGLKHIRNIDVAQCLGATNVDLTAQFRGGNTDTAPDNGVVEITQDGTAPNTDAPSSGNPPPGETDLPPAPADLRLSGASRFETSAAVALYSWPDGAAEVYLARADNPADALSGGSLPYGPVLLVPQCGELPGAIADAITALDADRVIALGGAAAVCDDILDAANALT